MKPKPHKHQLIINQWAAGYEIQYFDEEKGLWFDTVYQSWDEDVQYRVKPEYKSFTTHLKIYNRKLTSIDDVEDDWFKPNFEIHYDDVTGEIYHQFCEIERRKFSPINNCGPEAKFFKPKKSIWKRLFVN